ncbi:type III secretion system chaperone [Roseovarius dicentrarchi]|uniref:type III secretion system chaperone n=1 Tax=Roseovarius dicentrarchi TaxID=2250573 RepID=UPI000DE8A043|nr:type III secretion system chaperone [Roseovarius dicentrarchi]
MRRTITVILTLCAILGGSGMASGQSAACVMDPPSMSLARLGEIAVTLDPDGVRHGRGWRLNVGGQVMLLTADATAGRMRAMVPIGRAGDMGRAELERMLQANFDSAQDGRYAIAQGLVWSVFAHPLRCLDKIRLIEGVAQAVMLARTHGTLYSGGGLQFGGGDSTRLQDDLLEELLRLGEDL